MVLFPKSLDSKDSVIDQHHRVQSNRQDRKTCERQKEINITRLPSFWGFENPIHSHFLTQMPDVWNICLHVGKYSSPMGPVRSSTQIHLLTPKVSFQGHAVDLEGVLDTLIYTPPHNMSAWEILLFKNKRTRKQNNSEHGTSGWIK